MMRCPTPSLGPTWPPTLSITHCMALCSLCPSVGLASTICLGGVSPSLGCLMFLAAPKKRLRRSSLKLEPTGCTITITFAVRLWCMFYFRCTSAQPCLTTSS
eukprot:g48635.t1